MPREFTVRARISAKDEASGTVKKAEGSFRKFGTFLKNSFVITLGDVSRAARAAFDLFKESADLTSQTNALKIELAKQGQSFDGFIGKLRQVSHATVSNADLIKSSSKALLLGIPADQIAELLEIARASAIATGQSVSQAFDDIATGIGRASPLILDNLGITVKLGDAYERMAQQLGKGASELTAAEQKQGLLNAVLEVGKKRVEAYGDAQDELSEALQQAGAAQEDFRIGAGKVAGAVGTSLAIIVNTVAAGFVALAVAIQRARLAWNQWTGDLQEALAVRHSIGELDELFGRMEKLGRKMGELRDLQIKAILREDADAAKSAAGSARDLGSAIDGMGESTEAARGKLAEETAALDETTAAQSSLAESANAASAAETSLAINTQIAANALTRTQQQVVMTARAFDQLAASAGRAAAVQAAVAGGGELVLGGTRVNLPGGGSRLTHPAGGSFSNTGSSLGEGSQAY